VESLSDLHDYLKEQIGVVISQYVTMTEHCQIPAPAFLIGFKVWLNTQNIKMKWPTKKLNHNYLSPFKIDKKISMHTYWLKLPLTFKAHHSVFHGNLLELVHENDIPNG
jgi:hypothetical protein